ncbi:hypothetical protein [Nocardia sp. NBC_00565]|uniref:hypothetical protein n=1 Tax=Nocardia sp. NBC_00565 TaxID=2975993 RepID=UPI002E7FBCDD|nr:hypothetical protein [Nocardia sp. NBC_00565]
MPLAVLVRYRIGLRRAVGYWIAQLVAGLLSAGAVSSHSIPTTNDPDKRCARVAGLPVPAHA